METGQTGHLGHLVGSPAVIQQLFAPDRVQNHCHNIMEQIVLALILSQQTVIQGPCAQVIHSPPVIKLEFIFKLKIKRNDWLLADTCSQAANHFILF